MPRSSEVDVRPIGDAEVDAVAAFLHANMNERVSTELWQAAMRPPWRVDAPNHGFMLWSGGEVVGAYLAIYSERMLDGRTERFCNLAAWCVLEPFRFSSIRLLKALLAQEGYHFTDLSPSGTVVPLNRRLKFQSLDTTSALAPNLPWPTLRRRGAIVREAAAIERALGDTDLQIFRDHARAGAARHLLLVDGDEQCYLMFRRDRRKNLPLFASFLHVSNPALLQRMWPQVSRHLLLRHRLPVTLTEVRVTGFVPRLSRQLAASRPKMFRSATLRAEQIDYLYSELVALSW